jgi:uncharacterized membrane protein YbaN (DUF454 family)
MFHMSERLRARFFVVAGTIFIAIGVIGVVVPILPTTPFLLLAAICYMRGSQRLYNSLLHNRIVGGYIKNYLEGRGMSPGMKIWTLSLLWVALICTAALATDILIVRFTLAVVLIGVTIHIVKIKTLGKPG